jgi:hypothetical protein
MELLRLWVWSPVSFSEKLREIVTDLQEDCEIEHNFRCLSGGVTDRGSDNGTLAINHKEPKAFELRSRNCQKRLGNMGGTWK